MRIRSATTSDVPALVELNRSVQAMHVDAFPERFRPDALDEIVAQAFAAAIQSPTSCWLLAEQEAPIGFLSAEFRDREANWCQAAQRVCYLTGIVVTPGLRQRGVARALVAELKREAESRRAASVELDVWAFNQIAFEAFTRLGFTPLMQRMTMPLGGLNPK